MRSAYQRWRPRGRASKIAAALSIIGVNAWISCHPPVTPLHIVPEWYFLEFYALLKAVPNKIAGFMILFLLGPAKKVMEDEEVASEA